MPTKHIDDKAWRKIQDLTVKTVIATQKPIKETDFLHYVLKKGLDEVTVEVLKGITKNTPISPRFLARNNDVKMR